MSLRIRPTASSSVPRNTSFFPGSAYDVFISFRGEDTRTNFTDHLYNALVETGIHTFRDDEELERGEVINDNLMQAIEESRIFIVIFSKNYANSKWCLKELVKIMDCSRARRRKVFPIFYHVDPSEVRNQHGEYGKALAAYENNANLEEREQIQRWRTALTEAGNLGGCHVENQLESEILKEMTRDVLKEIMGKHCGEDGLVGKTHRLKALKDLIGESENVLMVGIFGLGGIGKTTIARALYDEIYDNFEGASFLENIGEVSKKDVLYRLQDRLFCDILLRENKEIQFHKSRDSMKDKISRKKVLIILDDVNNVTQLQILAGKHDWFGKGSRIVITTKNRHLLHQHEVNKFYEPKELDVREALELFSYHAKIDDESRFKFFPLSAQVIDYCYYNPLTLQVMGSLLHDKNYREWQDQLKNLARESPREKLDIIRVSYNELNDQQQYIFLDVACFFTGEYKDFVIKVMDGHGFSAKSGVKVLTDRSLITVSVRKLWMPSVIQELGRKIVQKAGNLCCLCDRKAGTLCRLWDPKDIEWLLRTKKGIHAVEGISFDLSKSDGIEFSTEVFAKMTELKLLKIFLGSDCVDGKENSKVNLSEDFRLPCLVLRYLHWHGYQLKSYPSNFEPRELLELNMPYSCLEQINRNEIHFPKLTILNLSHSQHLENTSNISRMPNLERLVLEGCRSLVEVDSSIGDLNNLSLMNLKDCKRLNGLPASICRLKFLETLILTGCSTLSELPDGLKELHSLVNLKANGTSIRGITLPLKLRILHLRHCKMLQGIPVLPSSIQEVDAYNCISMDALSWNDELAKSILPRIQTPESEFSILLPGNTIPCGCFTHKVTGSSMTMKLPNPDWYNDDFLGFAVCLVFTQKAGKPHLNPEILCELDKVTFFYSCGEESHVDESAESDEEWGNNSTDHVWLAYRGRARAERCGPKEWKQIKASFEVFACEVKECAICLIYDKPRRSTRVPIRYRD